METPAVPRPRRAAGHGDRVRLRQWRLLPYGGDQLPGRHLTDHQVRLYMRLRRTDAPAAAAAKAGFSPATAYRLEQDPRSLSPQDRPRRSRRRPDPLAGVFEEEIVPLLEASPTLRPIALFEELMRRRPDLPPSIRRTLE